MDKHPPNFDAFEHLVNDTKQYVGTMQYGYKVHQYEWENTLIFAAFDATGEWVGYVQYENVNIPNYGQVLNTLATKVKEDKRGNKFSLQLRLFISLHLGKDQLVGNVISVATENLLPHMLKHFSVSLINATTGEQHEYSPDNFMRLSSISQPTEWQILLSGSTKPYINETPHMGFAGPEHEDRHLWTYGEFFEDVDD